MKCRKQISIRFKGSVILTLEFFCNIMRTVSITCLYNKQLWYNGDRKISKGDDNTP